MSTHTATVETLTAQVRVLQVGNKQVTTSMAKQLVMVTKADDMEVVFGNISLNGVILYIGRRKGTGELVTCDPMAFFVNHELYVTIESDFETGQTAKVCRHRAIYQGYGPSQIYFSWHGAKVKVGKSCITFACNGDYSDSSCNCSPAAGFKNFDPVLYIPDRLYEEWENEVYRQNAVWVVKKQRAAEAKKAPRLILGGLR